MIEICRNDPTMQSWIAKVKSAPMLEFCGQRMEGRPILVFGDGRCGAQLILHQNSGKNSATERIRNSAPWSLCQAAAAHCVLQPFAPRRRWRQRYHGAFWRRCARQSASAVRHCDVHVSWHFCCEIWRMHVDLDDEPYTTLRYPALYMWILILIYL